MTHLNCFTFQGIWYVTENKDLYETEESDSEFRTSPEVIRNQI